MATIKQKRLVKKIIENNGNVSKSMKEVGYSEASAKNPHIVTNSKGFKELVDEYLPDSLILGALEEDIKAKKQNRKGELELAAKIKKMLSDKVDHDISGSIVIAWGDDEE